MACPQCKSNNLWDDNMWWGCNDCGWMNGGTVRNEVSRDDRLNGEALRPATASLCKTCKGTIPASNSNQSYCSEVCRREGWRSHHPNETEPDWDSIPLMILV